MLILSAYMIIGAVLLYIIVDGKKLDNEMAGWYDEYVEEYKDSKHGYFERSTFDKSVKCVMAAWFLFAWPSVIFLLASKLTKGKK